MTKRKRGVSGDAARRQNKVRQRERRAAETEEERNRRLSAMAIKQRERRAAETEKERNRRLSAMATKQREKRAAETEEERNRRLSARATKQRKKRASETEEERKERLAQCYWKRRVEREAELRNRQLKTMRSYSIGHCSQDMAHKEFSSSKSKKIQYQSKEKQKIFNFSKNMIIIDSLPVIKTEILDPSEKNQEFILPDYLQHVTTIHPMRVIKTEIQDSPKTNKLLLPNIKVETTEIENAFYQPSRTGQFSNGFINKEIENFLIFKCKLIKCSVLLHDCLIPKNLASISANFKSLRINTDIVETFPKIHLFPLNDTPFFPHISEAYKKMAFHDACKKIASVKKEKKSKPNEIHPNNIKNKKSRSKKYICNCFKAPENSVITTERQLYENNSELTQQLCSCQTNSHTLSDPIEMFMKETSLFDPDFGKITCGIGKID